MDKAAGKYSLGRLSGDVLSFVDDEEIMEQDNEQVVQRKEDNDSVWETMSDDAESMRCKVCNKVISNIALGMHEMSTLHKRAVKGKEENDD